MQSDSVGANCDHPSALPKDACLPLHQPSVGKLGQHPAAHVGDDVQTGLQDPVAVFGFG